MHVVDLANFSQTNVDVLVVEHDFETLFPGTDGHINHEGLFFWPYDTKGRSGVGDATRYGSEILYTKTFHIPWVNYIQDSPYDDFEPMGSRK